MGRAGPRDAPIMVIPGKSLLPLLAPRVVPDPLNPLPPNPVLLKFPPAPLPSAMVPAPRPSFSPPLPVLSPEELAPTPALSPNFCELFSEPFSEPIPLPPACGNAEPSATRAGTDAITAKLPDISPFGMVAGASGGTVTAFTTIAAFSLSELESSGDAESCLDFAGEGASWGAGEATLASCWATSVAGCVDGIGSNGFSSTGFDFTSTTAALAGRLGAGTRSVGTTAACGSMTMLCTRIGNLSFGGVTKSGRRTVWTTLIASGGLEMISCRPA